MSNIITRSKVYIYLFKTMPAIPQSQVRWGYFSFILSLVFFFFAVFISLFTLYLTPEGKAMTAIYIGLWVALVIGILLFIYAVYVGVRYQRNLGQDNTATKEELNQLGGKVEAKLDSVKNELQISLKDVAQELRILNQNIVAFLREKQDDRPEQ